MIFDRRGFNTIELLVGVAILSIVIAAGATLAQVAERANNYPDRKMELLSLSSYIMENLKNEKTCTSALAGNNLDTKPNSSGKGNAYGNQSKGISGSTGRKLVLNIPNLQVGTNMQGTVWDPDAAVIDKQILPRRLQINDISLRDGILLNNDGTNKTYLGNVYLEAEEIGGVSFKPQMIGTITLITNLNDDLSECQAVPSNALAAACSGSNGMGCIWDPNTQPNCRCLIVQEVCAAPGYYPTSFEKRVGEDFARPVCTPLGGGSCTNADEFLTGIGLGKTYCGPVPTTCPAGSSTTGAGNPVAGLIRCKCDLAGQTYITGTGCAAAAPICNGGSSLSNTGGPAASPAGCFCAVGQTWDGANCNTPTGTRMCPDGTTPEQRRWSIISNNYGPSSCVNPFWAPGATSSADNCYHVAVGTLCRDVSYVWACETNCASGPVAGVCGTASGTPVSAAPTTNLCSSGTATSVNGSDPWTWGCNGANGGTSTTAAACSAAKAITGGNPTCWTKTRGATSSQSNSCSTIKRFYIEATCTDDLSATADSCYTPGGTCTPIDPSDVAGNAECGSMMFCNPWVTGGVAGNWKKYFGVNGATGRVGEGVPVFFGVPVDGDACGKKGYWCFSSGGMSWDSGGSSTYDIFLCQ